MHLRTSVGIASLCVTALIASAGCCRTPGGQSARAPLPESAYHLDARLKPWIDPETKYDTSRSWKLEGGDWPIALVMSPSQSPQLLVAERDGLFAKALKPHGVTPTFERIDLPPRTFHALQRSKWPFAYMPIAVFTDYARGAANQGGAGGLQYVALAGSTSGGGYTMVARDPSIRTVKDLRGKLVAQMTSNPVPATLLAAELKKVGLKIGEGPDQVRLTRGVAGAQTNLYESGKVDALITLNILKAELLRRGSHAVTDFSDAGYTANYTILAVERSVYEGRPEVVKAFLEAHYKADKIAEREWDGELRPLMLRQWNDYFRAGAASSAQQRGVPDQAAFDIMLGNMRPEDRIDPRLLAACFATVERDGLWDWPGRVDVSRLSDLKLYDSVLTSHHEMPQR